MAEHFDQNPQNNAPVKEVRAHSTFDLSHYIFGTHRFANYNVNFARNVIAGQSLPLRSSDIIDSYTLKAPLMQDVQKTKEYFFVPKQCLMPINWDKIERLPALGDDVDATLVNSTIVDFQNKFIVGFANLFTRDPDATLMESLTAFVRKLLFTELFFSQGSLLAATGTHLSPMLSFEVSSYYSPSHYQGLDFDTFFDLFFTNLMTNIGPGLATLRVVFDEKDEYTIVNDSSPSITAREISLHRFLELARDNYNFKFSISGPQAQLDAISDLIDDFFPDSAGISPCRPRFSGIDVDFAKVDFSVDRAAAYQIVCAHYFSHDSIDYIHDADLWRQNMISIVDSYLQPVDGSSYSIYSFQYNGVKTLYDVISNRFLSLLLGSLLGETSFTWVDYDYEYSYIWAYFINLLGWRRSLRFGDYFVGSKARPLAVGDFSIAVNNNAVDVIDITKRISYQRLANNVNRIGNSIKEWYHKIMGSELAYDYHNPMWLASTRSTVYAVKNENTNNADVDALKPVNTSANFAGRDSDFEFTVRPDRNGVVVGITYYDIRRAYSLGIDRMSQHVDRFDGFIPDLQFIGDQDINFNELVAGYGSPESKAFAYTLRNMEYKQYYDECYGGFATGKLPGFAFLFKPEFFYNEDSIGYNNLMRTISPEFIRSRCDEFDQFYISLAGYSNANYFHFIVKTFNDASKANLPMVYAPQIL